MIDNGFTLDFRAEYSDPFFKRGCFTEYHAWRYLVNSAAHKDHAIKNKRTGEQDIIKRGQVPTSIRRLSDVWLWDRNYTTRFIQRLEESGRIKTTRSHNGTRITIVNYDRYQPKQATIQATQMSHQNTPPKTAKNKGLSANSEPPKTATLSHQNTPHIEPSSEPPKTAKNQGLSANSEPPSEPHNEPPNAATIQNKGNIQNKIVCVYREHPEIKLLFSEQEYIRLYDEVDIKDDDKRIEEVNGRISEMLEWQKENAIIEHPKKMFKTWKRKNKNPGEQRANQGNHTKTPSQRKPVQNTFHNFSQRNYDMDELEKKLMGF